MKGNCKYTDFGMEVKTKLLLAGKTQMWLQEEVARSTGLFVDGSYMTRILTGQRNAPKIVKAICKILDIEIPADIACAVAES